MRRHPIHIPFAGVPPQVSVGDPVECRNAYDEWVPMVAVGPARYDDENSIGGQCWLSVPVVVPAEWKRHGARARWMNWPAEDVRLP